MSNPQDQPSPGLDDDPDKITPTLDNPHPTSSLNLTLPGGASAPSPPTASARNVPKSTPASAKPSPSPFGPLSPDVTDRVFPIRSAISVEPSRSSSQQTPRRSFEEPYTPTPSTSAGRGRTSYFSRRERGGDGEPSQSATERVHQSSQASRRMSVRSSEGLGGQSYGDHGTPQADDDTLSSISGGVPLSARSVSAAGVNVDNDQEDPLGGGHLTSRFQHVITAEGHAVLTGQGTETLQRCEDEPIHIPGAVQGFGALVALREEGEGKFVVRIVSENSEAILGHTPGALFKLSSFTDVMSDDEAETFTDQIDFVRDDSNDVVISGPEVFSFFIKPATGRRVKLWCAMHISPRHHDLIICEFELEDDKIHPLVPGGEETPPPAAETLSSQPTDQEIAESTLSMSKPLRVLRNARKHHRGEGAAMEVFNIMSQIQEQLSSATNLELFLKVICGITKELTGFHRVMIYQFDDVWNGKVVAELLDLRATRDLYRGLNFPASDIPKQARELYKINKVRLLYDRDQETARLVCRTVEDLETPLDLTHSYLRAMSPIHLKYLANMAVRASMSISITAFGELWGLISCHTYGVKGMRVAFPIRKMCRLVGEIASRNIERLSYASRLQARKLINTVPTEQNPSGYIVASSDDLLKLFDADFGLLSIKDETKILGKVEHSQEALAMLEYLRMRGFTTVLTSQQIDVDFPDLKYAPGFSVIAGLLLVPLSIQGEDFIVFFRKSQLRLVHWAGNPYEKTIKKGTEGYLEPRKSFKTWSETVAGKSREWTEEQIETAAVLCLVYGKFIEVWRQKEAALQNSQLTRLLLSNASHEVRTPLNAIINYLEIAMESPLDEETRGNLAKSHSASKSLIYVINDLLDLTRTEEGNALIKGEVFNLPATIREATDMFKGEASRKDVTLEVIEHPGVPQYVRGDSHRVRQAVSNITANAFQHTHAGGVKVELYALNTKDDQCEIEITIQDTGAGMSAAKLDSLFRGFEQVQTEEDENQLLLAGDSGKEALPIAGADKKRQTLGLGLAVVARFIRNMDGQLRLRSEEGKGSRFTIQLTFELPSEGSIEASRPELEIGNPSPNLPMTPPPRAEPGEVTLVAQKSQEKLISRPASATSGHSSVSSRSGSQSRGEADRLINAIQGSPYAGSEGKRISSELRRSASLSLSDLGPPVPMIRRSSTKGEMPEILSTPRTATTLSPPGQEPISGIRTPLKPVRMGESSEGAAKGALAKPSTLGYPFPMTPGPSSSQHPQKTTTFAGRFSVLVAEDDPINSRIVQKRLEKLGHTVHLTVNGEECANVFEEKEGQFDVVLMDMQMPIVDGFNSTKMIRSAEKTNPKVRTTEAASSNGRVPIIAVSASLIESRMDEYMETGFDGWILKPIDFQRLNKLMTGIVEEGTRDAAVFQPGQWEKGGWFKQRQTDAATKATAEVKK